MAQWKSTGGSSQVSSV